MNDEAPTEQAKPAKSEKKHAFEVVRGFWDEDGVKVAKGAGVELSAEDAMDMLESGIVRKMAVKK